MPTLPLLRRVVDVRPGEVRALAWSFLYFFFLLSSYYVLRPLRDERGIASGMASLPWLFSATFATMLVVVPLWSALLARVPRARLLPFVYRFFLLNLVVFWVLFRLASTEMAAARAFFVWTSVFNYLAVSVFWSFMADIFRQEQGKRLFGFIAAGGSAGAILGPLITAGLVETLGLANLLLVAALLLEGSAQCIGRLTRLPPVRTDARTDATTDPPTEAPRSAEVTTPVGGGALSGIGAVFSSAYLLRIAAFTVLAQLLSTFGYFLHARLVSAAAMDSVARTALFARIDLAVNLASALLQALVAGRLLAWTGVRGTLAVLPPLAGASFAVLAASPVVATSSLLLILRRALGFGIALPAVQVLYTVVDDEQKYKSKAFVDTVVTRGSDALHAWAVTGLLGLGLGVSGTALVAMPFAGVWLWMALSLGRRHQRLAERQRR